MKLICMVDDWEATVDGMAKVDLVYVMDLNFYPGREIKVSPTQLRALVDGRLKHLVIEG